MGTRGSIGWTMDGKEYTETYNHYDSYPERLGCETLEVLKAVDLDLLKKKLQSIEMITDDGSLPTAKQIKRYQKYSENPNNMEKVNWYWLLKKMQGAIKFKEIAEGDLQHVIVNNGFMKDGLSCEYAYMVNFKTNKLEFFTGGTARRNKDRNGLSVYSKCKKVGALSFKRIKSESVDDLMKIVKEFYLITD